MQNWDYNLTTGNGPEFIRWKLERMINYGLKPNERLPVKPLKKILERPSDRTAAAPIFRDTIWGK